MLLGLESGVLESGVASVREARTWAVMNQEEQQAAAGPAFLSRIQGKQEGTRLGHQPQCESVRGLLERVN